MPTVTAPLEDYVESLAAQDPTWLAAMRREAFKNFLQMELPHRKDEKWRFTNLSLLNPEQFVPPSASEGQVPSRALPLQTAGRSVHVDSSHQECSLSDEARRAGVIYVPFEQAAADHSELLRPRLATLVAPDDIFKAWSLAAASGGMFLYVPRDVVLSEPIQALHWASQSGTAQHPRTVVVVEDGARVIFNDLYLSDDLGAPTLASPAVELFAGPGSHVGWLTWQDWGRGMRHLAHVKAHLDADASLDTLLVTLGGDYSRTWKECVLAGEGSRSIMLGLYFPHEDQMFEHWTVQDHAQPHTTSDLLYKGALTGHSNSVYYGTIRVRPGALKTDAYQANRNLTLSPKARALTNPQLEIENNDVRCTHGATVGQIDEDHLFYIQSRGVPRAEAERLVVFGFFNEVLGRVAWSGMQDVLAETIRNKMQGATE